MKLTTIGLALLTLTACGPMESGFDSTTQDVSRDVMHIMYAKTAGHRRTSNPVMTSHGGAVLHTNKTQAIFWGTSWSSASFAGDKVAGIDSFLGGFGGSRYAGTSTEYYDSTGSVTTSSTYLGHVFDNTADPTRALSTSDAVTEACKMVNNNPDPNGLYMIFTDYLPSGISYCAWHSYGTCSNGAPIQVAYFPAIDGWSGCDPKDTWTTHSEALAALTNVAAHELSETITDPRGAGWYDSSGAENGDKCAWSFNSAVTLSNNTTWKLQMEWSNNAYNSGTGLPNSSGQNGCLQGS